MSCDEEFFGHKPEEKNFEWQAFFSKKSSCNTGFISLAPRFNLAQMIPFRNFFSWHRMRNFPLLFACLNEQICQSENVKASCFPEDHFETFLCLFSHVYLLWLFTQVAVSDCWKKISYRKCRNVLTEEIESCDFEPPHGATWQTTLYKQWQNY